MAYSVVHHRSMLFDERCNVAYLHALKQVVTPDSVVLDLGCGLGIHSLLAAQLGARHIYLVEPRNVIAVAEQAAKGRSICAESSQAVWSNSRMTQPNLLKLIQPETVIARREDAVVREEGEGLAIMLAEAGQIIQVDEIGAAIWQHLVTPRPIAAIISHLLDLYDVDPAVCERQTLTLMRQWLIAEIITSEAYVPPLKSSAPQLRLSRWQRLKAALSR
ncbi:MAG: PqqD family peptide modification chaperone [Candidatus Promineifilaceae bacterium]